MSVERVGDLWWKNAVIYCLDVETFLDMNGDGIGDFAGLTERVDYLAGLGVTCIWLMPFHRSPNRDDGYDIVDYFSVDPRLGDLGSFTDFIRQADSFGIKVIADLVVNHTSDEHPWFQAARSDPQSEFRNFYVWRDEPPEDWDPILMFPGQQTANWTFDEVAGQYYLHYFFPHQPDLNMNEPAVRDEMAEIVSFWIQQGLAGFRVDAVPFLVEFRSQAAEAASNPHGLLRDLRDFLSRRRGDAILLGEVNLPPVDAVEYFGSGDQLHMLFNFYLNQYVYLALARNDPDPIRKALLTLPDIPPTAQWANFLKNHDEQTLDLLTRSEREEVFAAFGPEPGMQLFGRGLRRRLPSMLEGDQARLRLAYSLLFSLPGTPVLFYGEEIGMAENLDIEGRSAVRSPMQWQSGTNGGFSMAPAEKLRRPLVEGQFGPEHVNVADQRRDPNSLLNWMERLIRRRRETAEFGMGKPRVIEVDEASVFVHICDFAGRMVLALHNFGERAVSVDLRAELGEDVIDLIDLWSDRPYELPRRDAIEVDGCGYRWIRVRRPGQELLL